jgi:DNA-binding beta-propeller fold protein YncE
MLAQSASLAVDAAPFQVSGSISGPDGGWDYVSVDVATHRLYVARGYGIMAVDLANDTVIPAFAKGQHVHGVLPLPGGTIISTNEGSSAATLLNGADGTVLASFPTGRKPDAIAYDKKTGLVAVMNGRDGTVMLIDPVRRRMVGSIDVGGTLEFAEGDGEGRIYVNVKDRNEISVLDFIGRRVVTHYPLAPCEGPTGLALDLRARIALAVCDNGKAVALSLRDGHVIAVIAIGEGPDAAILDAKNERFLVPCGGDGVLDIIREMSDGTLVLEGTVPTAKGARTAALDPTTGKLYLPTADFEPRKPGEWQGAIVPGSFRILVLSANGSGRRNSLEVPKAKSSIH